MSFFSTSRRVEVLEFYWFSLETRAVLRVTSAEKEKLIAVGLVVSQGNDSFVPRYFFSLLREAPLFSSLRSTSTDHYPQCPWIEKKICRAVPLSWQDRSRLKALRNRAAAKMGDRGSRRKREQMEPLQPCEKWWIRLPLFFLLPACDAQVELLRDVRV